MTTSDLVLHRECLLYRITGDMDHASHALDKAPGQSPDQVDKRLHASFGHTAIQSSLNYIQLEHLVEAANVLDAWQPTSHSLSAMEEIVLFRKHIVLGKLLRYQGQFRESLANLETSKRMADQCKETTFLEDGSDLTSSLADTLLELGDPIRAENCLRAEIEC
jgi:hypothetical protein